MGKKRNNIGKKEDDQIDKKTEKKNVPLNHSG